MSGDNDLFWLAAGYILGPGLFFLAIFAWAGATWAWRFVQRMSG